MLLTQQTQSTDAGMPQPLQSTALNTAAPGLEFSLDEMAEVLDVARALAQEKEFVEQQFRQSELRETLKQRLLAGALSAGRNLTPAEIDHALDLYLTNLHTFREPPWSWSLMLAHLYIRRWAIGLSLVGGTCTLLLCSWLYWSTSSPFSTVVRQQRLLAGLERSFQSLAVNTQGYALPEATQAELQQDQQKLQDAVRANQVELARQLVAKWQDQQPELRRISEIRRQSFDVHVVSGGDRKSGIDRYYTDADGRRVSGYYLIVEARSAEGTVVPQDIRNAETQRIERVSSWGERVPKAVYDRLVADKKADGILDESLFARKRRDESDWEMVMPGEDGQPLTRQAQITQW
jgi:hypothetical protein